MVDVLISKPSGIYGVIKIIIHNRYITAIIFGEKPGYDKIVVIDDTIY